VNVLAQPDVKEKLLGQGAEAVGDSPAQLSAVVKKEIAKWKQVVKSANIKVD
jgi:tripartite-type tricarboxylate transporter receptor subunit TctC